MTKTAPHSRWHILRFLFQGGALLVALVLMGMPVALAAGADDILPPTLGAGAGQAAELPTEDLDTAILPNAIKILLQLVGTISFGVFIYSGVMLVISQGNEEEITKFKGVIIWSGVGLAFVMAAYAIVSGVLKIKFS